MDPSGPSHADSRDGSEQADIVAQLCDPETYGRKDEVLVHRTHGSMVFLSGPHAYKLKRAVKFPYMDYSTPALRKAMCMRELEVNLRTAPQLYRGVQGIVAGENGLVLGDAQDARAMDWVVVMTRFAQEDLLESRRKAGILTPDDMTALGEAIAAFHGGAEHIPCSGGASGIRAVVAENVSQLGDPLAGFPEALVARYAGLSAIWLGRLRATLGTRRRNGMVRRCHGDLHLNNVCLIDGRPVLFDAIEFNDAFSCIDIGYDLAFLLMDLDSHGLRSHANAMLNRYLERSGDYGMLECLPLFLSCRAAIRAHVTAAAGRAGGEVAQGRPLRLLEQAIAYLAPESPSLVAIGGLSGTGKTTVARGLAPHVGPAPGAIILRSDVTRKTMFGVQETEKLGEEAYTPAATAGVYARLRRRIREVSQCGHAIVVDATFVSDSERRLVEEAAAAAGVLFHGLWLDAPRATLESRVQRRKGDASDADLSVLARQLEACSTPREWTRIDADGAPADVIGRARDALSPSATGR
jgi:aminoglycoside phosphotransferase family enzyme/predicted kinase